MDEYKVKLSSCFNIKTSDIENIIRTSVLCSKDLYDFYLKKGRLPEKDEIEVANRIGANNFFYCMSKFSKNIDQQDFDNAFKALP